MISRRKNDLSGWAGVWRRLFVLSALLFAAAQFAAAQPCVAEGRVEEIRKQLSATSGTEDPLLSREFVDLSKEIIAAGRTASLVSGSKPDAPSLNELTERARVRVCEYLNKTGWPTVSLIGREGVNAFMYLVTKALPIGTQLEIYPIVADALNRDQIERNEFLATYIDRLQLATGRRQLFGSQAFVRDGFLVLAPLERPSRVDVRRKEFNMEPLRSYEQFLESSYRMPLIRSVTDIPDQGKTLPPTAPAGEKKDQKAPMVSDPAEEPVIKIATALVTLDVVVNEPASADLTPLQKSDFRVFENGKPVEIDSFSRADSPFDIVLLLDMSGSTERQAGLIKKSTRRFIEMKRAADRVAVVSFSDGQTVLSPLESDKAKLLERIKDIKDGGGSLVWDSIKFAQEMLEGSGEAGRRKAIVVMTDGADNSLDFDMRLGSKISFADLVEGVQRGTTSIFPVFLDTTNDNRGYTSGRMIQAGRKTLEYLADQSAGKMYTAKKLEDVAQIYDRVLKDVGTVFTLGFDSPADGTDGKWRSIRVEIPSRPEAKLRHRPGYFPQPATR